MLARVRRAGAAVLSSCVLGPGGGSGAAASRPRRAPPLRPRATHASSEPAPRQALGLRPPPSARCTYHFQNPDRTGPFSYNTERHPPRLALASGQIRCKYTLSDTRKV
ncbi:unnamed protein product, partial [Iphiclides podalirius]